MKYIKVDPVDVITDHMGMLVLDDVRSSLAIISMAMQQKSVVTLPTFCRDILAVVSMNYVRLIGEGGVVFRYNNEDGVISYSPELFTRRSNQPRLEELLRSLAMLVEGSASRKIGLQTPDTAKARIREFHDRGKKLVTDFPGVLSFAHGVRLEGNMLGYQIVDINERVFALVTPTEIFFPHDTPYTCFKMISRLTEIMEQLGEAFPKWEEEVYYNHKLYHDALIPVYQLLTDLKVTSTHDVETDVVFEIVKDDNDSPVMIVKTSTGDFIFDPKATRIEFFPFNLGMVINEVTFIHTAIVNVLSR